MLIIEQDVDAPLAGRVDRWFDAYATPGTVYLPLVMLDSGNQFSSGEVNFYAVYADMLDQSLERPATGQMTVRTERTGDVIRFDVSLTNSSGETLSAANGATLTALLWEEPTNSADVPIVSAGGTSAITTLADGETGDYSFEISVGGFDPAATRWVVIADARLAGSTTAYDTLQAVTGP